MSLAKEYLQGIYDRHQRNIVNHLAGEPIHPNDLWLSVGYFLYGSGFAADISFATDAQWEQLMQDTKRDPERRR